MDNKEIVYGDAKFEKYATGKTEVIVWHDCLGSLNLTFKELSDKISRGELPIGTTIAAVFNKAPTEKTKPIWTLEEYNSKVLPQVGAIVEDNNRTKAEILFKKNGIIILLREDACYIPERLTADLFLNKFKPLETPQQKYNREMKEYVKTIVDKDPVGRYSIYDFEEGIKAAYKQFNPFQEQEQK